MNRMLKAVIVLLAIVSCVLSLLEDAGTPGVIFEQEGPFFQQVTIDESVVSPRSRVVIVKITNVTVEPTVSSLGGGGGLAGGPLNPKVEGSGDGYGLSVEVPERTVLLPGAPDPRYFVEVFEGPGFPATLTVLLKNVQSGSPAAK